VLPAPLTLLAAPQRNKTNAEIPPTAEAVKKSVNGFHPGRGRMFIARRNKTPPAAFGGAELYSRAEALVAFRSSERRWFWHLNSG